MNDEQEIENQVHSTESEAAMRAEVESDVATEKLSPQTNKTYLLKVIAGPHKGADIPLKVGTYIVGSGDEADIIFHDEALEAKHLTLILKEKTQTIKEVTGNVKVEGALIEHFPHGFQLYEVIEIGSTAFALGEEGKSWPELKLPFSKPQISDASSSNAQSETKETSADDDVTKNEMDGEGASQEEETIRSHANVKASSNNASTKPFNRVQAKREITKWFGMLIEKIKKYKFFKPLASYSQKVQISILVTSFFIFLLLIGALFSFLSNTGEALSDAGLLKRQMILAGKIIDEPPYKGRVYFELQDGRYFVIKGYLKDAEEEKKLKKLFEEDEIPARFQIYLQDRLKAAIDNLLQIYGLDLSYELKSQGLLKIEGFVDDEATLKKFLKDLRQDIPGIKNIQNNVISRKEIISNLEKILKTYHLLDKVTLHIRIGEVKATGELTPEEDADWQAAQKVIRAHLGNHFFLNSETSIKRYKGLDMVRQNLWGVSLQTPQKITFFNGNDYKIGDQIDTDLFLEKIDKEHIILRYKDQRLPLNYRAYAQWVIEENGT